MLLVRSPLSIVVFVDGESQKTELVSTFPLYSVPSSLSALDSVLVLTAWASGVHFVGGLPAVFSWLGRRDGPG